MIDCDGCTLHVAYVVVKSDTGTHSGNTRGWKLCAAALLVHAAPDEFGRRSSCCGWGMLCCQPVVLIYTERFRTPAWFGSSWFASSSDCRCASLCCQVAAFLSPLHPAWDLSLMFVMGGALMVALPGTEGVTQHMFDLMVYECFDFIVELYLASCMHACVHHAYMPNLPQSSPSALLACYS
jgi:hypothetical protein